MDDDETQPTGDEGVGDEALDTTEIGAGDTGGQQPPAPTQPAERTFTQAEVNSFIANERRKWQNQQRVAQPAAPAQPTAPAAETPSGVRQFDPETQAALRNYLANELGPIRQQMVANEIDRATNNLKAQYPELQDQAKMDEVINLVLTWDQSLVNSAPMDWLLKQGYTSWKYGNFDEKSFTDKIIQDYSTGKIKVARTTPTPQGSGGRAPTSPTKKKSTPGDFTSADAAMKQLIEEANANQ